GIADNSCDLFQHAETVVTCHSDFDWIGDGRAFVACPFDIDATFGFIHQVHDIGTVDRMHRYTFAASDVAYDGFTTDRIAALGAIDQQVALSNYADRVVVSAENPTYHAAYRGFFFPRCRGSIGHQASQDLARRIFAEADAGHQIFRMTQA